MADVDCLILLKAHRFLSSVHVACLVHADANTALAGRRAAERTLRKLETNGLVARLPQRVGGAGGGSSATVWRLTEAGWRLTSHLTSHEAEQHPRQRFRLPSPQFLDHTLTVANLRVLLESLGLSGNPSDNNARLTLSRVQTEPECWRGFISSHGARQTLKPDLYAELSGPDYDDLWFIEADLGTEHLPAIVRKARVYETYRRSGVEQAKVGAFPLVLWLTRDQQRAEAILTAITNDPQCDDQIHRAVTLDALPTFLTRTATQ
jgi:hypothetical protein